MIALATTLKNTRLQALADAINAGSGPGVLNIYDGTRPAAGAAITTQTKLASLAFADPCESDISTGVLTFGTIADVMALADGVASWARITDSDAVFVADADVGETSADIIISQAQIYSGGQVSVTAASITEP